MIDSAFITFSLDSFQIQKLRSSGIFGTGKDTDYASVTGTLINGQPETVTKKIGHIGTGTYQTAMVVGPFRITSGNSVVFNYTIINDGHQSESDVDALLEKAGEALASKGGQAVITSIGTALGTGAGIAVGAGAGAAGGATLGSVVVPVIGTIVGAVAGFLIGDAFGVLFADCDGVVALNSLQKISINFGNLPLAEWSSSKVRPIPGRILPPDAETTHLRHELVGQCVLVQSFGRDSIVSLARSV
jgi:hypothetical protein